MRANYETMETTNGYRLLINLFGDKTWPTTTDAAKVIEGRTSSGFDVDFVWEESP